MSNSLLLATSIPGKDIGLRDIKHMNVVAYARSIRGIISGTGADSNPCTVTLSCQTLQAALANTVSSSAGASSTAPAMVTIQNTLVSANSTVGILSVGSSNSNSIIVNNGVGCKREASHFEAVIEPGSAAIRRPALYCCVPAR